MLNRTKSQWPTNCNDLSIANVGKCVFRLTTGLPDTHFVFPPLYICWLIKGTCWMPHWLYSLEWSFCCLFHIDRHCCCGRKWIVNIEMSKRLTDYTTTTLNNWGCDKTTTRAAIATGHPPCCRCLRPRYWRLWQFSRATRVLDKVN